jgi:peptidoglycan hydrolase CwlO-like protein
MAHPRRKLLGACTLVGQWVFLVCLVAVVPLNALAQTDANSIQDNIDSVQKKLEQATKKKASLEQNLSQINQSISKTLVAINQTQKAISTTTDTIQRKELEIQLLDQQVDLKTDILADLMRDMYFSGQSSEDRVFLDEKDIATLSGEGENLATFQQKMQGLIDDIETLQNQTVSEKSKLEDVKQQHEEILNDKIDQKQELAADQHEVTADVQQQAATIAELQKKLQKLKNDLSGLLGTVVSTNDVKEAAQIASKATGVRAAFLLGELTQESGLGRFTGGCLYKNTRVKPADKVAFKQIMDELGYDVNKKKISCSPGFGYGGAMGIAQFMPTTWLGYKSQIASMTGHHPPDPWSVTDGVVGMAIKLARAGATSKSGEKNAAKVYYCGGPGSSFWNTKCESYAKNVLSLAAGYENN